MKVKIKSFNGSLPEYLTEGKEYYVGGRNGYNELMIRDDNNNRIYIKSLFQCWQHLSGGSWEVVE